MRKSCTLLAIVGLLTVPLLLTGCTFWVETSDGHVRAVHVADSDVEEFVDRMDRLSSKLLRETERLGDYRLRQAAVDLRSTYTRAVHSMGQGTPAAPVDLTSIQLRLEAFERQLDRRLTSAEERERYRAVLWRFNELAEAFQRFRRLAL